ncbi:MAG: putative XRE family transcriptional regulator [Arenicellales bacterium IbO2]|nr:helix-turn-helix domain-containing protein [Gammaproteobacteria bacterium]MDA7961109.1 helix-turn-helix domain-containing protein [Gammaproteobacteria bacterium]MDA7996140.1 helix-turn-helix domain-containing protein [Gammaproteobacteria bacterium]CAJ2376729.1 MAG: putative XRE family transcriptional regulator [Arenicellales bacterium IbO2]
MKFPRSAALHRLRRARAAARRIASERATPGVVLRRARERQSMTLAAAAEALRLPQITVAAIERDDYTALPGPSYALSYWRNYALLLGVDIEPSIAEHKRALLLGGVVAREAGVSASALARRGLTAGFALLSGLLLLALWHGQRPPSPSPSDFSEPFLLPPSSEVVERAGASEPADISSLRFALPEAIFPAGVEPVWRGEGAPVALPPANLSAAPQPAPETSAPQSPLSDDSENEITLIVEQDSWIEVRDANDAQLVNRMANRGQRLLLRGAPPFSIYIGNAGGVAIEYQGRPVRFVADKDGLFARFNVGPR